MTNTHIHTHCVASLSSHLFDHSDFVDTDQAVPLEAVLDLRAGEKSAEFGKDAATCIVLYGRTFLRERLRG